MTFVNLNKIIGYFLDFSRQISSQLALKKSQKAYFGDLLHQLTSWSLAEDTQGWLTESERREAISRRRRDRAEWAS